jgi:hypothetical protein
LHHWRICFLLLATITSGQSLFSQVVVKGTVFDISGNGTLEAVTVLSTSGHGTTTDSNGHYTINVTEKDSIWFSYLNKPTAKFAVDKIQNIYQFDISLHVTGITLKEVRVMPPDYRTDSIRNREEYAKVFNFRKPGLSIASSPTGAYGAGVGLDLDELINVFRFRRNRSMLGFQRRLLEEEQDKFIDHRFSKTIVRQITMLTGDELTRFMKLYRPSYEFTAYTNDYDFYNYIKQSYLNYKAIYQQR